MSKKNYENERKFVSRLIYMVLAETLHVKDAVLKFPKDIADLSVKAAYHALIHLEADEDLRAKDLEYKEEQDNYLEFIAQILQSGQTLPQNIIKEYDKYYKNIDTPHSKSMKGLIKSLCKFLNV
ncbi:MAG: hypothetical protein PHC64_01730 [Candidatus Gastranaerophilales bacterium]|nr:hypothetical protein [Candidatus Gastranaerophilales bacterium]